jgi:hypothetical protein
MERAEIRNRKEKKGIAEGAITKVASWRNALADNSYSSRYPSHNHLYAIISHAVGG